MPIAQGTMEVNIEGEPPYLEDAGLKINRNVVSKTFHGDIVGSSEAQMIAAFTDTPGSAGPALVQMPGHRAFHWKAVGKVRFIRAPAQRRNGQRPPSLYK